MDVKSISPVLNVVSVPDSFRWFEQLGWSRSFSWNDAGLIDNAGDRNDNGIAEFGGVCNGDCTVFLCRDGQGSRGGPAPRHTTDDDTGGVWMSWWLQEPNDVDKAFALAKSLGFDAPAPPRDEPWGVREFLLRHPDGHVFRVSSGLP